MFCPRGMRIALSCILGLATASVPVPVVVGPTDATAAVILLHGLGDSGKGLSSIASSLQTRLPYVRWIFPTAGHVAVSLNMGASMRAWFDIKSLSPDDIAKDVDEQRIKKSAGRLLHVVQEQVVLGISRSRIAVGGFSQGAVVSLFGSLFSDKFQGLAGCIALSGYFPPGAALVKETREVVEARHLKNSVETPKPISVLMVHGTADTVVPFGVGKDSFDELKSWSFDASLSFYKVEGMGHTINTKVLNRVSKFLHQVLSPDDEL